MVDRLNPTTAGFWKSELERSKRVAETHWSAWEENLRYYVGESADAQAANNQNRPYINIGADFYQVELKIPQLFYEQPDLQLSAKGEFRPQPPAAQIPGAPPQPQPDAAPILASHRALLNELLGPSHADALTTVQKAIKDCLLTAGVGATKIGYTPTMQEVAMPEQYGDMMGLNAPQHMPVDEKWQWERIPSKKFRIPADFHDTDFDKAPFLAMDFRLPKAVAERTLNLPPEFSGSKDRDDKVLDSGDKKGGKDESSIPYVDGTEIWYLAHLFDAEVLNPNLIRRHVVVEGHDGFVEKTNENPYQSLGPGGRLTADSMIGYPIHVLAIRTVPDSAFVPSDSSMTRPLVRELCTFRTQQLLERDANLPRILYDTSKLPPDVIKRIEEGTIGSMIGVEENALAGGIQTIMQQVAQGTQTRGSYAANDYIQRDLEKTLGIDTAATGVKSDSSATATEISVVDRLRNVRLDAERRQVLAWYLKGVAKFSALVCRYMTPQLAVPYIGTAATQTWAQWDKKTWDGRFVFDAKPDSQIKLDAAAERKFALDMYQFLARDPLVNRGLLVRNLFEKSGIDPTEGLVPPPPPPKPEPNIGFTFKGEDLLGPQAQQVREILAQAGIQISQASIDASAQQLFQQMSMGIRDANGATIKATERAPAHGGTAEQVRPLNQQSSDQSGQRPGQAPLA